MTNNSNAVYEENKEKNSSNNVVMALLLLGSMLFASANTILYKAMLNSFSSPTTNYGFFASQFSLFLYTVQAFIISIIIFLRNCDSLKEAAKIPHSVYVSMGSLDSASATLSAISGADCPGGLQTILNQMIIPMTLVGATCFGSKFQTNQIWGSIFILIGAIVASSDYVFGLNLGGSSGVAITESSNAVATAAIIVYFISVIPSAFSNIYKEAKMKEQNMNEVHTSTIVSFWQLCIGFLFLPLMSLKALGGLTYDEILEQMSDGFSCFMGRNPHDHIYDECGSAATMLIAYIAVNFIYNILLLAITKRGSAMLLVISQALSLPITNIAFSLKVLMGPSAEPVSIVDLAGLVLVCIGFLTYSGFGFATNFMVAQGPPGQMAYLHFEDVHEVVISTDIARNPVELAQFLFQSILQQNTLNVDKARSHAIGEAKAAAAAAAANSVGACTGFDAGSIFTTTANNNASSNAAAEYNYTGGVDELSDDELSPRAATSVTTVSIPDATPLEACRDALEIARQTVAVLQQQLDELSQESLSHEHHSDIDKNKNYGSTAAISGADSRTPQYQQRRPQNLDIESSPLLY